MNTFAQPDEAHANFREAAAIAREALGDKKRLLGENAILCAGINESRVTILSMKASLRRASQKISKLLRSPPSKSSSHTAMHNNNSNAKFPIQDTGATDTFYRKSDSKFLSDVKPGGGLMVGLPNGLLFGRSPPASSTRLPSTRSYTYFQMISSSDPSTPPPTTATKAALPSSQQHLCLSSTTAQV